MYSVAQFIKELPLLALVAIFCMLFVGFKRVRDFSISTEDEAYKDSKKIRKEFYKLISQIVAECKKNRIYVKVLPLKILNSKNDLGFSSTPSWVHVVVYTPVVIKYYFKDPRTWEIAIVQSIGHELGHWQDIYRGRFHNKQPEENQNFFYWTREIRCDFYGVDFAQSFREGYSRDEIITAVAKKADVYKHNSDYKPGHCKDHPSWEFRLSMLKKYTSFDERVIKDIMQEAKCTDNSYVKMITEKLG